MHFRTTCDIHIACVTLSPLFKPKKPAIIKIVCHYRVRRYPSHPTTFHPSDLAIFSPFPSQSPKMLHQPAPLSNPSLNSHTPDRSYSPSPYYSSPSLPPANTDPAPYKPPAPSKLAHSPLHPPTLPGHSGTHPEVASQQSRIFGLVRKTATS